MKYFIRVILVSIIASTLFSTSNNNYTNENSKDKLKEYDLKKAERVRQADLESHELLKNSKSAKNQILVKKKITENQRFDIDSPSFKLLMKEKEFRNNHPDGNTRECEEDWAEDGWCDEINNTELLCKKNPKSSSIILSDFLINTCRSVSSYS